MTNADRARRGLRAYLAVSHDNNDRLTNVGDLICDLLHFADTLTEVEFDVEEMGETRGMYAAHTAAYHYEAEVEDHDA